MMMPWPQVISNYGSSYRFVDAREIADDIDSLQLPLEAGHSSLGSFDFMSEIGILVWKWGEFILFNFKHFYSKSSTSIKINIKKSSETNQS